PLEPPISEGLGVPSPPPGHGDNMVGAGSALTSPPSFVDGTLATLPQVVSDLAGYKSRDTSPARNQELTFVTRGRRAESPIPVPEAIVDENRPVFDDKARFFQS